MISENTLNKIIRKTGRKPVSCKCQLCKKQCTVVPCLGTPQDIEALIDAGHGEKIFPTDWWAGMLMGVIDRPIPLYAAELLPSGCTFLKDGLCTLHDSGLKPTEGKLSHHSVKPETFDKRKCLSWNVAKEWLDSANAEIIRRIELKCPNK